MTAKRRILTGDTPTGRLHLGHYVGSLENRLVLQDSHEVFIVEADLHALTTLAANPRLVRQNARGIVLDNLAAGLDPERVVFFVESAVPEIYELAAFMSMYVSHARALRNPTVKDEIKAKGLGEAYSVGFVNYPIYQAADILGLKGELVPVGADQVAHLEQAREIARALNAKAGREIFPVPEALVGRVGKLVGTDGNAKMSKSLGNAIYLSDDAETVRRKVEGMYTDPTRIRASDPGTVEGNPVFIYLDAFGKEGDRAEIADLKERYRAGRVGDVEVKGFLAEVLERFLAPLRERLALYEASPAAVDDVIRKGNARAREEARRTLRELMDSFDFSFSS